VGSVPVDVHELPSDDRDHVAKMADMSIALHAALANGLSR
jgi:hypothetical protein